MKKFILPQEIIDILSKLKSAGFQAYVVGGPVRDIILERTPKDWDVTTDAKPEEIQALFEDSFYENTFGTVAIKTRSENPDLQIVEATTFRKEGVYSDFRHPDEVSFTSILEEDLARRDFTMNAIALSLEGELIDPFNGVLDIEAKRIKTVNDASVRFEEDALRLLRAVRFATELGFEIEAKTLEAAKAKAHLIQKVSKERIRDEFVKIVMSEKTSPAWGIVILEKLDLLQYILPELREGINVSQNKHHIYSVWDHNLRVFDYACSHSGSLEVRLASLFHDIAKPRTKGGDGDDATFYNHEVVGSKMSYQILERLKFSKEVTKKVAHLVRHHMFYYNVGEVTEAGVRRFIKRSGEENLDDLMLIREADRIGSGVPKAVPYKMRHLQFMIDKVRRDPISPKMLKIDGNQLMEFLSLRPCPKIGFILNALLEEVIEDPSLNTEEYLKNRALELNKLSDAELRKIFEMSKSTQDEFEAKAEADIKEKHRVK